MNLRRADDGTFFGVRVLAGRERSQHFVDDRLFDLGRPLIVRRTNVRGTGRRAEIVGVVMCTGSEAIVLPVAGRPWVAALPAGRAAADTPLGFSEVPIDLGEAASGADAIRRVNDSAWCRRLVPDVEIRRRNGEQPQAVVEVLEQRVRRIAAEARSAAQDRITSDAAALAAVRQTVRQLLDVRRTTPVTAAGTALFPRVSFGGYALEDCFTHLRLFERGTPVLAGAVASLTPGPQRVGVALPLPEGYLMVSRNGDALQVRAPRVRLGRTPIQLQAPTRDGVFASPLLAMRAVADPAHYGILLVDTDTGGRTASCVRRLAPGELGDLAARALAAPLRSAVTATDVAPYPTTITRAGSLPSRGR